MVLKQSRHIPSPASSQRLSALFRDNGCAVNWSAWLKRLKPTQSRLKKSFDVTTTMARDQTLFFLWVLSTWIWWVCLCFALTEQTVQHLSDKMGSIWAYLHGRWTTLSHFKMPRPDGVLFSLAPPFFPPLLQTNQYPHSLAFHRKDYREMAIKGLASITLPISKPLKNSGSPGLGLGTRCPVTLQRLWEDHTQRCSSVQVCSFTFGERITIGTEKRRTTECLYLPFLFH